MLPDPEALPEPLPEPESEPLDDEPEPPVIDPDEEPEPAPVELEDDEPEGVRELGAFRPLDDVPVSVELLEPESILPVAAPPREPLSLECEHPNASAPARIGIANKFIFIRHLLTMYFRGREESVNPRKDPGDVKLDDLTV